MTDGKLEPQWLGRYYLPLMTVLVFTGTPLVIVGFALMMFAEYGHDVCPGSVVDIIVQLPPPANISVGLPACINLTSGLVLSTHKPPGGGFSAGVHFFIAGMIVLVAALVFWFIRICSCGDDAAVRSGADSDVLASVTDPGVSYLPL